MKAEWTGQEQLALFASQHFNVEIGLALRSDRWVRRRSLARRRRHDADARDPLRAIRRGDDGIDGGGLDDLLAVAVVGRERDTRRWLVWARAFCNIIALRRRLSEAAALVDFALAGDLVVVDAFGPIAPEAILSRLASRRRPEARPGRGLEIPPDIAGVVEVCEQVDLSGKLAQVGVDAAGIGAIVDALAEIGITQDAETLDAVRQGISLMGAIKTIEIKLADYSFRHGGTRLMRWCVENLRVVPTPTAMRVARDESGFGKVDPAMALFNAAHLMSLNPDAGSVYETRGFLVV